MSTALTPAQVQNRQNIRNGFMTADMDDLRQELAFRTKQGDKFAAMCLREMMFDLYEEQA